MKTKSLLLGSAAALVAVTGARAADAVIIPEPEAVEYVRVCDTYGSGYFYIPGTETCLKVGGYVRFQTEYSSNDYSASFDYRNEIDSGPDAGDVITFSDSWDLGDESQTNFLTRALVSFTAKSETEYGTLTGFIAFDAETGVSNGSTKAWITDDGDFAWYSTDGEGTVMLDEAYIELGGLRMGYFNHWLDRGLDGETDSTGYNAKFDAIRYTANMGSFMVGVSVDEVNGILHYKDWVSSFAPVSDGAVLGVSGMVGADMGAVSLEVVGYYDFGSEQGGVRGIAEVDVGPGKLGMMGIYNTGASGYSTLASVTVPELSGVLAPGITIGLPLYMQWAAGVSYAAQVGDKLTVTPGFQWAEYKTHDHWNNGFWGGFLGLDMDAREWRAGVTLDYEITTGLTSKLSVQYVDRELNLGADWDGGASGFDLALEKDSWDAFLRFQRDF